MKYEILKEDSIEELTKSVNLKSHQTTKITEV